MLVVAREWAWLAPAVAAAPLLLVRWIGRETAWALFVALASLSFAVATGAVFPPWWHPIKLAAAFSSLAALLWSLIAWAAASRSSDSELGGAGGASHARARASASRVASVAAIAIAGVMFVFLAATRGMQVVLEMWCGAPLPRLETFGFDGDGVLMILAVILACLIVRRAGGGPKLLAAACWLSVLAVGWFAMLWPVFRPAVGGGYARTDIVLALMVGLSAAAAGLVVLEGVHMERARWRAVRRDPEVLLRAPDRWPGMRGGVGAVCMLLILLICLQITAPPAHSLVGIRVGALIASACGFAAGASCFALIGRRWSMNLADVALGLTTLAAAALAVGLAPGVQNRLGIGFPVVFNAFMIAMAVMCWLWAWLGGVWRQQLDNGRAWTSAGRLILPCERFAFLAGCLAVLVGFLMAIWPRMEAVAAPDSSLGRMAGGVGGHLLLILVLIRNGRALGRTSFGILTVISVLSLVFFITVRAQPFVSTVARAGKTA